MLASVVGEVVVEIRKAWVWGKNGNRHTPHKITACNWEYQRTSPDPTFSIMLACSLKRIAVVILPSSPLLHSFHLPLGRGSDDAAAGRAVIAGARKIFEEKLFLYRETGYERLCLPLWRKEPSSSRRSDNYNESDDDAPARYPVSISLTRYSEKYIPVRHGVLSGGYLVEWNIC